MLWKLDNSQNKIQFDTFFQVYHKDTKSSFVFLKIGIRSEGGLAILNIKTWGLES